MARPRKGVGGDGGRPEPGDAQVEAFQEKLKANGEDFPVEREEFREWLKKRGERDLWFFSAFILDNDWLLLGRFHRDEVCPWLTNVKNNRHKLLMLPMGHLKTTVATRSMPLHILIQPLSHNIYFPGTVGSVRRIALANENEAKAKESLGYIKAHAENNEWLHWCWPEVFWANPKKEANRWSDQFLELKRPNVSSEASITALGVNTGFVGRYFDVMLLDDIAALEASQSEKALARAKSFRSALKTRRVDKSGYGLGSLIIGVGTEWPAVDLYEEWQKDASVQVLVRSIIKEDPQTKAEVPLWIEKYPLDEIEKMRTDTDAVEWAAWYMNKRVGRGVTALDWNLLREYRVSDDGLYLIFDEIAEIDALITARRERINSNLGFRVGVEKYDPMKAKPRTKLPPGMDQGYATFMRLKYGRCLKCGSMKEEGVFSCGHEQIEDADGSDQRAH